MYGSQLWDLTNQTVDKMYTQWRNAHRRVLSVPGRTHCDLLPLIADNAPLEVKLDCKYIGFFNSVSTSDNELVKYVAKCKLYDHSSTLGRNMTHLIHKYGLQIEDYLSISRNKIKKWCYQSWFSKINGEYFTYAQIIREMIMMKENRCIRLFSNTDCNFLIDYLCII